MAEKKGVGHAYNVDFLNVVFAASSIFLLLSTVWMVWDDFDRDWKNTQRRFAQLQYDVTRAQYRAAARAVDRGKLQGLQAQLKASEQNVKANQSKVDGLQKKLDDIEIRLDRAQRDYQYMKATYDHDRYEFEAARASIQPDVVDDVNFKTVPKMDRCTTCHLGIDREAFQKYPQPFTTHPNLDAYLGSKSPHPIDRIGCTVCHDGMGQSVSFRDAAHTPTSEKQNEEWEKKYHWEAPHLWDYPMLPTKMTDASCAKGPKQQGVTPNAVTRNP